MEITLETIYQQLLDTEARLKADMKADKDELKADMDELKAGMKADMEADKAELKTEVGSVKTWFVGLALSTILVVTALMTTFLNMQ